MTRNNGRETVIFSLLGIIPAVWLGLLIAPFVGGGLPEIVSELPKP